MANLALPDTRVKPPGWRRVRVQRVGVVSRCDHRRECCCDSPVATITSEKYQCHSGFSKACLTSCCCRQAAAIDASAPSLRQWRILGHAIRRDADLHESDY